MTHASSSATTARRNLPLGLGLGAVMILGLCLVLGIGGGVALYVWRRQPPATGPVVEYVLDASPRMALPDESGLPRLDVARGVLAEIVRPADPGTQAGLRVFGMGAATAACQDTTLLVPLALKSQPLIADKISGLKASAVADATLAQAIVAAIRDLAAQKGVPSLVVVTGGADSCNADASRVVAQEAKTAAIDLNTYVVGYDVSQAEGEAIKVILDQTPKARYLGAKTEADLRTALRNVQDHIEHPNAPLATMPPTASPTATVPPTATPAPTATATPMPPTPTVYTPPLLGDLFYLDMRSKMVTSTITLADGHTYTLQFTGTFSAWDPYYWGQYGTCGGKPEPKPMFPSIGIGNGPVGEDPFYWFAFPGGPATKTFPCAKTILKTPSADTFWKYSLNGGSAFAGYGPVPPYNPEHTYTITLVGRGHPLILQQLDDYAVDNRGRIKIEITP
jgi:hypothetical protein